MVVEAKLTLVPGPPDVPTELSITGSGLAKRRVLVILNDTEKANILTPDNGVIKASVPVVSVNDKNDLADIASVGSSFQDDPGPGALLARIDTGLDVLELRYEA